MQKTLNELMSIREEVEQNEIEKSVIVDILTCTSIAKLPLDA